MWLRQDTSADNVKKGKGKTAGLYGSFEMGGGSDKEGQSSDGTPVELVYVPPFGSNYSIGLGDDEGYGGYIDEDEYKEPEEHQDVMDMMAQGGTTWDVYHHRTGVTGSAGLGHSNGMSIHSKSSPPTTAPIPIASARSPTPGLPTVVVDDQTATSALSSSGQVQSRGGSKTGNQQRSSVDEMDAYDFFSGPDLGEDYYYARRGGRGYDRDGFIPSPPSSAAAALGGGFSTSESERQRERERERRTVIPGGEERQSRSRSRSQSRTPSPALISSPGSTAPAPTTSNGQVQTGRKRSSGTPSGPACFMPASSLTTDLLSPPSQRGRTPTQPQSQPQLLSQPQLRGRSSTRTASTSSWEGESGSSVGSSPMGSLSPDGLVRAGGREREREEREHEKGRERRGRERTSGKMLSASEVESAASSGVRAGSGSSSASTTRNAGGAGGAGGRVAMDSSTTSSCSSSTSTVMGPPPSNAINVSISPINRDQEHKPNFLQQQVECMCRAEEEQRRRVHPTPSSSPAVGMRMSVPPGARSGVCEEHATIDQKDKAQGSTPSVSCDSTTLTGTTFPPSMAELVPSVPPPPPSLSSPIRPHAGVGHTRPSSYSEGVPLSMALSSPSKLRPPPLNPPPPLPAKPSTSFTAVSSSSPASPIISTITTTTSNKGLASPTSASSGEHTIVGKAVDIVSSAGAFLGLWQHSPIPEG